MDIKKIGEFEKGIGWNYIAIILMALNGFVCNFIIAYFYDASAVGLYNRIYSYYLVISQVSVFGIHMSIAQSIPKLEGDEKEQANSFVAALTITLFISFLCVGVMWIFLQAFKNHIDLITSIAMKNVAAALILFSVNKVILAFYNGKTMMKEHAVLQSVRYIMLGGSVLVLSLCKVEAVKLVYCFCIAEITVLLVGIILLIRQKISCSKIRKQYIIEHISFGRRILLSNIVLDLNTKVDIISLGFLVKNDYYVGIYSFAVMFIEGFYQILAVIRKSVNPQITRYYWNIDDDTGVFKMAEKITKWTSFIVYFGIVVGYLIICLLMGKDEYLQGVVQIAIIGLSIVVTSRYILYGNVFSQIGKPQIETSINLITVVVNICFNFMLIPVFKNNGAAIATSLSYFAFAAALCIYKKGDKKICIFFNN